MDKLHCENCFDEVEHGDYHFNLCPDCLGNAMDEQVEKDKQQEKDPE